MATPNQISVGELEHLLRKHTIKLRGGIRGLASLLRRKYADEIPSDVLTQIEEALLAETERAIEQMTTTIREGI